ncbi:MAG TPA: penicillin acylase family protein [Gemmatimonadales bacterium]|nr:penicillin acylase family protein [Gemmatimonadales bacterium]
MKRKLLWGLAGLALVGFWVVAAAWLWLKLIVPPLQGREQVAGLGAPVTVVFDSLAVPHVMARNEDDLFAALGYLHARERLWQMDLLRHAAAGRLSELFGAQTVGADRAMREREMLRIARARVAAGSPDSRRVLNAYARGVNAWIARHNRALEFRVLRHDPEPWLPEHSVAIGVLQAWELHSDGEELALANAIHALGAKRAMDLLPSYPDTAPLILPHFGPTARPAAIATVGISGAVNPSAAADFDRLPAASNAWVVGPRWTASRKAILANDPHLTLRAPSIWYLVGAHAPGYEVVGATIPGVPVVVLGHNARLGWGFTNAMVDDMDFVVEQLSADSTRVRTPTRWAPLESVAETIVVRGGAPVTYARRRTAHGPLVDVGWTPDSAGRVLAMRWVAQDSTSDEMSALLGFGRARSLTEFQAAVAGFRSPEQNVVYGDADGNIAYFLAGHVPVRRSGKGMLPTAGWSDAGRWTRYLDVSELPHAVNPPEGMIVTANNRVIRGDQPFISNLYELPYRAERIIELTRGDSAATAASVGRHQLDQVDVFARNMRDIAARAAADAGHGDIAQRLRSWDGSMAVGAREPAIFWSWYRELLYQTYEGRLPTYHPAGPLHRWMAAGDSPWFDDPRTPEHEDLRALARRAMDSALVHGADAPWGRVHHTIMEHPLGAVALLNGIFGFNVGPFANGGDTYTINVAVAGGRRPPFSSDYGPSLRHVVDFGDVDGSGGFILPTGESGHPMSEHYRDQTARWRKGQLWVLPVDVSKIRGMDTLYLLP